MRNLLLRIWLLVILIPVTFQPGNAQQEEVFVTDLFYAILTSQVPDTTIRNVDIYEDLYSLDNLVTFLKNKVPEAEVRDGRVVIRKNITFENVGFDQVVIDSLVFEGDVQIRNSRKTGPSGGWLDLEDCAFHDLLLDGNSFRIFTIGNSSLRNLQMIGNSGSEGIRFKNTYFEGQTTLRDNTDQEGIYFIGCSFAPTAGRCLAKSDSLTYGRPLTDNVQFLFTSSGIGNHAPVNLRIESCHFMHNPGDSLSQRICINNPNIADLLLEANNFESILDLNGSVVANKLIIRSNRFRHYFVFNELILSEVFNIIYWDQFSEGGKVAVYEELPVEDHCESLFGRQSVLYLALTDEELANGNSYEELVNAYHKLFTIARSRGDIEGSNGAYVEMKNIMTRRYAYLYTVRENFETYFKWKLNEFLLFFTDYGTKPGKAVEKSIWIILLFAAFYFLFPSEWNVMGRKTLVSRINLLIAYFRSEKTLYSIIHKKNTSVDEYRAFKIRLNETRREVPGYIYLMGKPIADVYDFFYRFEENVYMKFEILSGRWVDLDKGKKWLTASVIGVFFLIYLIFSLAVRSLNAITLSVNAFTTLGFGIIPTKGLARYVAIVQGFIGWFLLSIFIVALINQVLA